MFCAISGTTPQEPVINKKTGYVYEKRVIEKYLEANGNKDPNEADKEVTLEDLLPVKSVNKFVPPRPTTATSIPSMLQLFQNEWDAVMLETYSLKQQLDNVRQELAHALYQHDAACRVIARLIKERDEARNALASLKATGAVQQTMAGSESKDEAMEVESTTSLNEEVKSKMVATSQELAKERKKRETPEELAKADQIKAYDAIKSVTLHKTTNPGISAVDIHPNQNFILTGGFDSSVILFDKSKEKIQSTFSEHKQKVTDVLFHSQGELFFSTSADKTAKIWSTSQSKSISTIKTHTAEVVGCTLQATGDYWATASKDGSWAFHDIESASTLLHVTGDLPLHTVSFHPDGLILGTGTSEGTLKIWDMKSQKNVATFEGHKGNLHALSFSENGYYLATAADDNIIKLWDLRKLKNIQSVTLPDNYGVTSVEFDYSGTYLAASGSEVRVFLGKTFNHIATYKKHKDSVTDVKWASNAQWLASVSVDRNLKIWGPK